MMSRLPQALALFRIGTVEAVLTIVFSIRAGTTLFLLPIASVRDCTCPAPSCRSLSRLPSEFSGYLHGSQLASRLAVTSQWLTKPQVHADPTAVWGAQLSLSSSVFKEPPTWITLPQSPTTHQLREDAIFSIFEVAAVSKDVLFLWLPRFPFSGQHILFRAVRYEGYRKYVNG